MKSLQTQVGGNHYKNQEYQVIEFLNDNPIPASISYTIKYITRYPNKNQDDLDKAIHCLEIFRDWFRDKTYLDDASNNWVYPSLGNIKFNDMIKFTHQLTAHKAIVIQHICELCNITKYFEEDYSLNIPKFLDYIDYVIDIVNDYKEGTFE